MDTNKMRAEFEAALTKQAAEDGFAKPSLRRNKNNGDYVDPFEQAAWWGWQASREAVVVELPKVVGFEGAYDSHRHHEFVPSMSDVDDADEIFGLCRRVEAKEAIEAQGLKVAP